MRDEEEFSQFVARVEPRLRQALIGARGPELGREATAEALAWAWEHWDRVQSMTNAPGYLFRIGQSRPRCRRMPEPLFPVPEPFRLPDVEPRLPEALARLSDKQRVAVFLVHGCGWAYSEVAELLEVSVSTVRNHLSRGLHRLREVLEVNVDVQ